MSGAGRVRVARRRVLVVAPLRFPIRQPHAGGLESAVWNEVRGLRARGHHVSLVAVEGSEFLADGPREFVMPSLEWEPGERVTDSTYPRRYAERSVPALGRALDLVAADPERFDVVSNHCLHGLPLERAGTLGVPMVSTLHTPVDDDLVAAHHRSGAHGSRFLAVSEHTRQRWLRAGIESTVLPNGIEVRDWPLGPGGPGLVWFGRIVPEKAPHLAVEVARRLGRPLTIAGRVGDVTYAAEELRPLLGPDVRHVGELDQPALARLVGRSALSLSTPVWAEPFGLVAPEALVCGTPVASFAAGGVGEIARGSVGMAAVPAGDVDALTAAAARLLAETSDPGTRGAHRSAIRAAAVRRFSLDARIEALEGVFDALLEDGSDARLGVA